MKKVKLDFEPIFYVLDDLTCRVMAVRKQDKYEMKGVFIVYQKSNLDYKYTWMVRPACMNNQQIQYHPSSFEVTKNRAQAFMWAIDHRELQDNHPTREWADYAPSN